MKSILFDLDNTLYPEETYVKSGFEEVSKYLAEKNKLDFNSVYSRTMNIFKNHGRGKVFNLLLEDLGLSNEENILSLVYVYRYHYPNISLYDDTLNVLKKLKNNFKLGLITDGRSFVQKRKVEALGLEEYFDTIIFTDVLGEKFWKPSTIPYKIALKNLDSKPIESAYVGDDPYKDFKAPKKLNMKSIHIKREEEMDYWKKRGFDRVDADYSINRLNEILDII